MQMFLSEGRLYFPQSFRDPGSFYLLASASSRASESSLVTDQRGTKQGEDISTFYPLTPKKGTHYFWPCSNHEHQLHSHT